MKSKNILTAAAFTAASLGFACTSSHEAEPKPHAKTHEHATTTQTKTPDLSGKEIDGVPLHEVHGLARGDKIELINVYTPRAGEEKEYILKPSGKYYAEDIGVIYAADLSRFKTDNGELPKEVVCLLISSFEGKIAVSGMKVDRDTHEVLEFSSMHEVEKPGPVYSYTDSNTDQGYSVYLAPLGDGSARLVFDGVPPYDYEQDIKDFQSDHFTTA